MVAARSAKLECPSVKAATKAAASLVADLMVSVPDQGDHQEIIRRSSGDHQEIIRRSSGDHQEIIRRSSGDHQEIIRRSSGDHQAS
jgi:hypothetical protein